MKQKLYLIIPAVVVTFLTFLFRRSSCVDPMWCEHYSGFPIWFTTSDYSISPLEPIVIIILDLIIWYGIFYLIMLIFKKIKK
ncbi:MAG: hypothetical protein COX79_00170 [Candidatus Levybacteria bacterium CG_4_10_14_0_2_um_filter_36_16]|nr:MAG: hypothetical protein AUK12_04810 [Candidatus Levybacteria bacterium CG2_30_37_29]PIZ98017.1 MAG: hypothetical protein COX79_00170 [Candidatus Levybacteria bacterium CG_4_10_14_0_2_um_filter_36_16]